MERKMTMIKLLLLIPALLFGLLTFAQKAEPKGSVNSGVKVDPAVSNVKASTWKLESEVANGIENMSGSAVPATQKPEFTEKSSASYNAQKQVLLKSLQAQAAEIASQPAPSNEAASAKLAASPNNMWDITLNVPVVTQTWGVESDGNFLYATQPYDGTNAFAKYTTTGSLVETFNITGVPIYASPNYYSCRDMAYDGQYWYAISYEYPSAKLYKLDLPNKNLISTITLPFSYGYQVTFDQGLDAGNGGFWCGDYYRTFSVKMDGTLIGGPYTLTSSCYGSATDEYSNPGTKYIWYGSTTGYALLQWNPLTQTYNTGVSHALTDLTTYAYPYPYGLSDSKLFEPGKLTLLGTVYSYGIPVGFNYHIFGYEMGYTVSYPTDAGVKSVLTPVSGVSLSATAPVQAIIRNYGTSNITNIPVKFSVNGVDSPTEIITQTLVPGMEWTYTFNATADIHQYNNWTICVSTVYPGDQFALNDKKCKTVTNTTPLIVNDTIRPTLLPNWTGTVQGTTGTPALTITQTSQIEWSSGAVKGGWAKFPLSSVPPGAAILDVQLRWYLTTSVGAPFYYLRKLTNDPVTNSASGLWNEISTGFVYNSATGSSHYTLGWNTDALATGNIKQDIATAASPGGNSTWFAFGFNEYETPVNSYYGGADGWNQTNKPQLIVRYETLAAHDVAVTSIMNDDFALAGSVVTPSAKVRNVGTTNETFTVTMTGPAGYTSTKTVTRNAQTADTIITFAPSTFPAANSTFTCCVSLATDMNFFNQCLSKGMQFDAVLTRAYGFVASPQTSTFTKGSVAFFLEHPDYLTQLSSFTGADYLISGTWGKDPAGNGTWYATDYFAPPTYNHGYLIKINTTTGAQTNVGPLGVNINGLSYDYTSGKLYGIGSIAGPIGNYATTLYEINRTTGQAVLFCNLGYTSGLGINLACNDNGTLYFYDIAVDKLFVIDPLNYDKEAIGPATFDMNYSQDMEFDRTTGKLYLAAFGAAAGSGALYKGELSTGTITKVKGFPGGLEMTGFAIPHTPVVSPTDLGLMMIKFPKTGNLTTAEPVIVKIRNFGTTTVNDCKLSYKLGTGVTNTEQWTVIGYPPLTPGDWVDYSFSNLENLSAAGTYCFKAWVWNVPGDVNWVNDTVAKCVKNTSCVLASPCYPNAIQESEQCGDNLNGGCTSTPPAYITLTNGTAYCGDVWKVDTLRDTDWYTFTISSVKTIRAVGKAEFGMDISIVGLPCSTSAAITTKTFTKCVEDSLVWPNLVPGTYALVVAPNFNEYDIVCGFSNRYSFKFSILPPRYCYPASTGYTGSDEYITNVQFGSINNTSGFTMGGWADYTNISTYVQTGDTVPFHAHVSTYWSADYMAVYIDWNQNYLFDAANEKYPIPGLGNASPGQNYAANIIIPNNIAPGPRTMRVRMSYSSQPDPCTDVYYSEGEDYTVFVIAPIPTIVTTVSSLNQPCPGTKIVSINTQACNNIQSMNLKLTVGPNVTLTNYYNLSTALNASGFVISQTGTQINATWFSLTPASVGTGKLIDLELSCPSGNSAITFDLGADGCGFSNAIMGNLDASWINGTLAFGNCSNLIGKTYYAHKTSTGVYQPLTIGNPGGTCDSIAVQLIQGGTVVHSTCPDAQGNYSFLNLDNGTYTLKSVVSGKKWGGVNANDAQAIMRNFVHLNGFYLTGIYLIAAEINGVGAVPNALDALIATRRFVGIIPNFLPPGVVPGRPDWCSESFAITVNGTTNQTKDVQVLCTGDVNGTYTPFPPMKNSVIINNETSITVDNDVIDLPIYAQNAMNVGSVSLVLDYPANLQVLDVMMTKDAENLVYTAKNGHLRMAWFSIDPMELKAGDVVATLKVKVGSLNGSAGFTTNTESVLSDGEGIPMDEASLIIPKLVSTLQDADYSLTNVPNPFNAITEIRYSLPQAGNISLKVYNVLGEEIATLFDGQQSAGKHTLNFDGTSLSRGVYMYKLKAGDVTKVKTMVITE